MVTFFHQSILLPFYERVIKGRKTFRYWAELERSQWLSRSELEERQLDSLRRLLEHASWNCSYYKHEWERIGLQPSQIATLVDFQRWPLITKDTIRANRSAMRADLPGLRMLSKATGGSSGAPLQFDLNMESHERRTAAMFRGYNWAGGAPGTRQLYLWGVPLGNRSGWKRFKDRFLDALNRRLTLNSFDLSRDRVPEFLKRLNWCRPTVIVAYTNPMYAFAKALEEAKLIPYSPQSIIIGAEKIYPFQRELIERVFRAPVFETYGAREFMLIGGECEKHSGLHLTIENLVVEIVDDDGRPTLAGHEGNVCVTDLTNYGMPFVRYLNGDRAMAGLTECTCGRGLPIMQKVTGRQLDLIDTPDGRTIPGEFFPHLLKDFAAIERFQVMQDSPAGIDILLVLRPDWSEADRKHLDAELRKVLGPEIRVNIIPVGDIPLTAAGKQRVVVRKGPLSGATTSDASANLAEEAGR